MCGITGIVSTRDICRELFEGMQSLEYRGYDSAGMAVLSGGSLEVRKDAGKIAEVEGRQHLSGMMRSGRHRAHAVGHSWRREPGQFPPTRQYGQLFCHCPQRHHRKLSLLQNRACSAQGYVFRSETDSEVIVHLIAAYHAQG